MEKIKRYVSNTSNLFLTICIIFIIIAFFIISIGDGAPLESLRWSGGTYGIFADFYETMKDARYLRPYDGYSVYPPLVYVLFNPLSNLIIANENVWDQTPYALGWVPMSTTPNAIIVSFTFFAMITIMVLTLASKELKHSTKKAYLFALVFLASPGYIFMIERGNLAILATLCMFIYLYLYDSENEIYREIALISLAIAACFKIYPAILGILLLIDKRYKDAIRCIIYGLILFIVPFFVTGGIQNISKFITNIQNLNLDYQKNLRGFGYGYKINILNFVDAFVYSKTGAHASSILTNSITVIFASILLFVTLCAKARWKKIMALTLAMIILPGFSYIYTAVYMIVPLTYYLKENIKVTKNNIFYTILLILIFSPTPYGFLLKELPGGNKLTYPTLIVGMSLIAFTIALLIDTIKENIKKCNTNVIKKQLKNDGI